MESKFLKITDKKEWQDLMDRALFKTFFHDLEWEGFLEKNFKWLKFERYVYNNSTLLSLARAGNKLVSHPFCEYGGPLPLEMKINLEQFKYDLFSQFQDPLRVKISFHPEILWGLRGGEKYFSNENITSSGRCSFFIAGFGKSSREEIWKNFRKSTRQEIEKANGVGMNVRKCQNEKELQEFYRLYLLKSRRHKVPAYPYSFFKYFLENEKSEIILAEFKGRIAAGSVFLFYDKYIHYFLNASDNNGSEFGANHFILWEQIKKYCGKGRDFDLGGTRMGSSLEIFKRGFDSTPLEIFELRNYAEKPSVRQSKLRNIFGLLPVFLVRKASPYLLKYKL